MPRKASRNGRTKSHARSTASPIPPRIFAQASPRSIGGVSMFDAQDTIRSDSVTEFVSDRDTTRRAVAQLRDAGFDILQVSPLMINIAGSASTYQKAFKTKIETDEREVIKPVEGKTTATFLDCPDTPLSGLISTVDTPFEEVLEGVALEEPRYYMAGPLSLPPTKSYWHLNVPADVSLGANADKAHRAGITGRNVNVVMVDSGWYKHPFFGARGYRVSPVVLGPSASNPARDESGHGTGESANVFAVAPDAKFTMVKMSFVNSIGAFNKAVSLRPDIISCSWGSHLPSGPLSAANQALAAAVAAAVASGIIVIFSAGNGHAGFPGQHPDVISAGGVFMTPTQTLQASNYASGFMSTIYPDRRVPDVCGLVGMRPRAAYIMLPIEPGDEIDVDLAGGTHPAADETTNSDGWAAFSGTSAAAPQLAGAAALIKQACPTLKPKEVREIMMKTARDVTTGTCNAVHPLHTGLPAGPAGDGATGAGLIDAHHAAMVARIRHLGPVVEPAEPVHTAPADTLLPSQDSLYSGIGSMSTPKVAGMQEQPTGRAGARTGTNSQSPTNGRRLTTMEVASLEDLIAEHDDLLA